MLLDTMLFVMGENAHSPSLPSRLTSVISDAVFMDLDKQRWETLTDLDSPRARPLISMADHADPP